MEKDIVVDIDMQTIAVAQQMLGCSMEQAAMTVAYAVMANCSIDLAHVVLFGTPEQQIGLWIRARV